MKLDVILVPTDFSEHAERALEYALELAGRVGARVHVLHAYPIDVPAVVPGTLALPPSFQQEVRGAGRQQLDACVERASGRGVELRSDLRAGPPVGAILEVARQLPADLIVLGTHGRTGIAHALLGSVAERTVRLAPCPVLTLRADSPA